MDATSPITTDLVDVVVPCRNEEQALPGLLAAIPPQWRVIVVDNGSSDRTAAVAREAGATVVHEPVPGYGAAVHHGLTEATGAIVVILDGDGSVRPADAAEMVTMVHLREADLVCGSRRPVSPDSWPTHARWGNRVLASVLSMALQLDLHDIAPVRVARRDALIALAVEDRRFGYPLETLLRARAAGWRILERPIAYHPRDGGRSKVTGSLRGTARALHDFAAVLVAHRKLLWRGA